MPDILPYRHITDTCFADAIGAAGLKQSEFEAVLAQTATACGLLREQSRNGALPLLSLPAQTDDLPAIEAAAHRLRDGFDSVVVLGTGGSSLGGQTLTAIAQPVFGAGSGGDRVYFLQNVDSRSFEDLFRALDLRRTAFIVISKSGRTAETLAQFLVCLDVMRDAVDADRLARHFTVVTENTPNPLRRLAEHREMQIIDHDPDLGGRYSALSVTGLLPSAIAGLDPAAVRTGALAVLDVALATAAPKDCEPAIGAALNVALLRNRNITSTVLMSYGDALVPFGLWFRQLWAESLGKDGAGTTPIHAMGTMDQHSQLQLYLAGPNDKMYTFVVADSPAEGRSIGQGLESDEELDWLLGRTMDDLLGAAQRATAETLVKAGRPVRSFRLDALDGRAMGAMMMHFMLETIITAHLLDVDPFDQPAVEEGKRLARSYLEGITPRQS